MIAGSLICPKILQDVTLEDETGKEDAPWLMSHFNQTALLNRDRRANGPVYGRR
jgi:hypothetical protein